MWGDQGFQSVSWPSITSATSPSMTGSLNLYKVHSSTRPSWNRPTKTQSTSPVHWRNPGTRSKMLKVSCLFVLLCGLLGPSSAQGNLPQVPTYVAEAITKTFLDAGFLSILERIDWQRQINNALQTSTGLLGSLTNPLTSVLANFGIQMRNPELQQVSFAFSSDRRELYLQIPFRASFSINILGFNPVTLRMQADMRIQLQLADLNGKYQLVLGNCNFGPDSVRLQIESSLIPFANVILESIQRALQSVIPRELAANMCPLVNTWFSNLDFRMIREMTNAMLQQREYRIIR